VKLMVFVTITQGFIVNMLVSGGTITDSDPYDAEEMGLLFTFLMFF